MEGVTILPDFVMNVDTGVGVGRRGRRVGSVVVVGSVSGVGGPAHVWMRTCISATFGQRLGEVGGGGRMDGKNGTTFEQMRREERCGPCGFAAELSQHSRFGWLWFGVGEFFGRCR